MRLARKQTFGLCVFACVLFNLFLFDESVIADDRSSTIVLRNATVHSMGGQGTFVGSVVVVDGKITAIGVDVESPKDAIVYDLTGCHVVPGLIESRGKLWLSSAAIKETNTKAELNIVDAVDPWSEDWRELAAQGITSVYVQPSSTSSLGGYGAVLRVGPQGSREEVVLKSEVAVQASIGTRGSTSKDRYTQIKALEKLLESAKEKQAKDSDDKTKNDGAAKENDANKDKSGATAESSDEDAKTKDDDSKTDAAKDEKIDPTKLVLRRVLNKEIPLFIEVHHSDALKHVLALAKKLEIRIVIDGLSQINGASEELAEVEYPLVAGPFYETGTAPAYRKNAKFDWLSKVSNAGNLWALSSFSSTPREARLLRIQAAFAIGLGAGRESVLAAMTSNAARILGIAEHVGSLEVGKQADIAVFAGDPLDPSVPTRLVLSHGKVTFENETSLAGNTLSNPKPKKLDGVDAPDSGLPKRLPAAYSIKTTRLLQNGKFVEGTLNIKNGRIVSIGNSEIDANTTSPVFDVQDTIVSPGLVMASSSLGQASAIEDGTESDTSHLRAVDSIDLTKKEAFRLLAGGFIHVGVSPGTTNTSSGVAGHVRLGAADYVANPVMASQFVLSDSARRGDRFPSSLNGQIQLMNDLFAGRPSPSSVYVSSGIGRMIASEKLANISSIADRSRVAIIAADSKLEIRSAISLAKNHKLRAALLSEGRVGEFAKQLADQEFGLIVSSFSGNEYDAQFEQILEAQAAGVNLAFAGESPEKTRITAALLVNAGLARESALLALSDGGGRAVGMENIGLAKDAPADFVVWSDSPLNLASKPLVVVVDGQVVTKK